MKKKEYQLECYENVFDDDFDVYSFDTLEQAMDFIRVHKLKSKYRQLRIIHNEFVWESKRPMTFKELSEMGIL